MFMKLLKPVLVERGKKRELFTSPPKSFLQFLLILLFSLFSLFSQTLIFTSPLKAATWEFTPKALLSPESYQYLTQRHRQILSQKALQNLLIDISRLRSFKTLEAYSKDGHIIIKGGAALTIGDIEVDSTSRQIEIRLKNRLYRFVGQVDAPKIMAGIRADALSLLKEAGYYKPVIKISKKPARKWQRILLKIEEDYPCRIRKITTSFKIPKEVSFDIQEGDICSELEIKNAIERFGERLVDEGYHQKKIQEPKLTYDKASNSAILTIDGSIGQKIGYTIITPVNEFLAEELTQIDPSIIDPDAMRIEIIRNYRNSGYDDVLVKEPDKAFYGKNNAHYDFYVTPGVRYLIENVEFQGVHYYEKDDLIDLLGFDGIFASPLSRDGLRAGVAGLKGKYQMDGFWDVEVPYPRIAKNASLGEANLVFIVREGKQRVLRDIIIKGQQFISESEIKDLFDSESGEPLSWKQVVDFEKKIHSLYKSKGFLYAEAKLKLIQNRSYRSVPTSILVQIEEGKRVKFGDISIIGLVHTKEKVVKRELRFEQGEWYNPKHIEDTKRALIKLGVFSSVSIGVADNSALIERLPFLPLKISLREGKPGNVAFGPGWSISDGARYVIEASYANLGGVGRKVYLKGKISEERRQEMISNKSLLGRELTIGYVEPYILSLPFNATYSTNHQAIANKHRWEITNSGEVSISHEFRRFFDKASIETFYGIRQTTLETNTIENNPLIETGDTIIGEVGVRLDIDNRDNFSWTTKGYRLKMEASTAKFEFGGDTAFFRTDIQGSTFFKLSENTVLALGFSGTKYEDISVKGQTPDVLPTSERLEAGGSQTNRGFKTGTLGPIFRYSRLTEPLGYQSNILESGGSARGIYKMELRYKFARSFGIAGFIDSSNVFFTKDQENIFQKEFELQFASNQNPPNQPDRLDENAYYDFIDLAQKPAILYTKNYVSFGLALNWLTPLGSVDFSYGIPYKRCLPGFTACYQRGLTGANTLQSGVGHVSIGADF